MFQFKIHSFVHNFNHNSQHVIAEMGGFLSQTMIDLPTELNSINDPKKLLRF